MTAQNVDLAISGRMEIPKTRGVMLSGMLRMLSGTPYTLFDSNIDADQNGVLYDPLPAGTYSGTAPGSMQNVEYRGGRNGARGPGFMQLDLRVGYRARLGSPRTLDVFEPNQVDLLAAAVPGDSQQIGHALES